MNITEQLYRRTNILPPEGNKQGNKIQTSVVKELLGSFPLSKSANTTILLSKKYHQNELKASKAKVSDNMEAVFNYFIYCFHISVQWFSI